MAKSKRDAAKESFWREVQRRQAISGLSVRSFCRQEQLSEASFYAWRRTTRARDGGAVSAPAAPLFVPAVVRSPREASITLELAGGRVLRLPPSFSTERLVELVEALDGRRAP